MGSTRLPKESNPQRWQEALERAHRDEIIVRQINRTGQWIATSCGDGADAYELDVIVTYAYGCSCPAAEHGDPVCKHRAAFYAKLGFLELSDAPSFDPTELMYPPLPDIIQVYAEGNEVYAVDGVDAR